MTALQILREVLANPDAIIPDAPEPLAKPVGRPTGRWTYQPLPNGCKRHPSRPKNPMSKSFCNDCLNYFRTRKPPKGTGHGGKKPYPR